MRDKIQVPYDSETTNISIADIALVIAKNIKVILIVPIITSLLSILLALKLKMKLNKPIVVIAFGESGSSVFDWQYGKYRDKFEKILKNGSQLSGGIKFFLWHQGETDAIQKVSKEAYFDTLAKIIIRSQEKFPESKFGVSIATKCGESSSKDIQEAQYRATHMPNVFKAADSDSFPSKYRFDGCHLNMEGAHKLAQQYYKSIMLNLR